MTKTEITTRIAGLYDTDNPNRDMVIITLVQEGVSLNTATREFVAWAKAEGITSARVSHKDDALGRLEASYPNGEGWDAKAVKGEVIEMSVEYDIAESTARDYCKAYSEELGVPYPVANPREAMFGWLKIHQGEEPEQMKADFIEYCEGLGRSRSNINEYWKGYELHLFLMAD